MLKWALLATLFLLTGIDSGSWGLFGSSNSGGGKRRGRQSQSLGFGLLSHTVPGASSTGTGSGGGALDGGDMMEEEGRAGAGDGLGIGRGRGKGKGKQRTGRRPFLNGHLNQSLIGSPFEVSTARREKENPSTTASEAATTALIAATESSIGSASSMAKPVVYFINVDSATQRRSHMQEQLSKMGFPFVRVRATTVNELSFPPEVLQIYSLYYDNLVYRPVLNNRRTISSIFSTSNH